MRDEGFYRVKVEERTTGGRVGPREALVLHAYRDGVEVETVDFELSANGARRLLDEVRWLEWRSGR